MCTFPAQYGLHRSTPSWRVEDVLTSPRFQGAGSPRYKLEIHSSTTHEAAIPSLSLSQAYLALTLSRIC